MSGSSRQARCLQCPQGAFEGPPLLLQILGSLAVCGLSGISARFATITISCEVWCAGARRGAREIGRLSEVSGRAFACHLSSARGEAEVPGGSAPSTVVRLPAVVVARALAAEPAGGPRGARSPIVDGAIPVSSARVGAVIRAVAGTAAGPIVGARVGASVGATVGASVGSMIGAKVGAIIGARSRATTSPSLAAAAVGGTPHIGGPATICRAAAARSSRARAMASRHCTQGGNVKKQPQGFAARWQLEPKWLRARTGIL